MFGVEYTLFLIVESISRDKINTGKTYFYKFGEIFLQEGKRISRTKENNTSTFIVEKKSRRPIHLFFSRLFQFEY